MASCSPLRARERRRLEAAGFLLPLSTTAALLLLLSSLSLQTASLQARRQLLLEVQQRHQQDLLTSAAHHLLGRLKRQHPCLLERTAPEWAAAPCLAGQAPETLRSGQLGEHRYALLEFQPTPAGAELRLALAAGGPSGAFALVHGELRELGLRAAPGGAA
jgi:hypothetical protein